MTAPHSDCLVFFGVTGDLAYKQIFPALQAMIRRGHLDMPIIGVAGRSWSIQQLQEHVHDSLKEHGGVDSAAFAKLCSLLQYISGDYHDAGTYSKLRRPWATLSIPCTTWQSLPVCLLPLLKDWSTPDAPKMHA